MKDQFFFYWVKYMYIKFFFCGCDKSQINILKHLFLQNDFLFVCVHFFLSSHIGCITESVLTANNCELCIYLRCWANKHGNQALGKKAHSVCKAGQWRNIANLFVCLEYPRIEIWDDRSRCKDKDKNNTCKRASWAVRATILLYGSTILVLILRMERERNV